MEGRTCSKTTARIKTPVAALRTEPIGYTLYPVSHHDGVLK